MEKSRYLGDGLYAEYDGWHIWLKADRDGMTHSVALEPPVWNALVAYVDDLKKEHGDG
jgi:sialic acid synthase SpsE